MKKNLLLLSATFLSINLFAGNLKPIAQKIALQQTKIAALQATQLFAVSNASAEQGQQLNSVVSNATVLEFRQSDAQNLVSTKPENLHFVIPAGAGGNIELELYKTNFYTPDFTVVTSATNGQPVPYAGGVFYWGIIKGDNASLAAISIFNDEVMGIISSPALGNLVLGKIEHDAGSRHILYNDRDLHAADIPHCYTPEDGVGYGKSINPQGNQTQSVNCIRLYWEVNYDIYQGKGSVTAATNYVTSVFNESAILYTNDNIPVSLSQVYVWNTPSPYTSSSTSTLLSQFQSNVNSFNGDLGHLLGYAGGGGIAAGFNGLCNSNTDNKQCYSGISSNYSNVPTFSWTVEVVTHEQGHLMGSRHTHACVWNGNNTAIDNCGPTAGYGYEGGCSGAPTPVNGGTIMSYCHLVGGVGINFSNGFGPQPTAAILAKYNAASCLTACAGSTCDAPTGMSTGSITQTTAVFSWTAATGAVSYNVQYRETGTSSWSSANTAATSYNASALTAGTGYEWQVQTVCSAGSSAFTASTNFTTGIITSCGAPAGLSTTNISSTSAKLNWNTVNCDSFLVRYYETAVPNLVFFRTITPGSAVNTTITGLIPSTNYSWLVRSYCNGAQSGQYSSTANFNTSSAGCGVPAGLSSSSVTGSSALLSWNTVVGAGSYIIRYRVTGTSSWSARSSNTTNVTVTGLSGNSTYEWQVQANCASGASAFSASANFTTPATCTAPNGLSTTNITSTSAVLNWNTTSCDSFLLRYYKTSAPNMVYFIHVTPGTASSFNLSGLSTSTAYSWLIRTWCNNAQSGAYSNTVTFTTLAQSPAGGDDNGSALVNVDASQSMMVYPNPAKDNITVEFTAAESGTINLNIYDLVGQVVLSKQSAVHEGLNVVTTNTATLRDGVYIIGLESRGVLQRQRIIISK